MQFNLNFRCFFFWYAPLIQTSCVDSGKILRWFIRVSLELLITSIVVKIYGTDLCMLCYTRDKRTSALNYVFLRYLFVLCSSLACCLLRVNVLGLGDETDCLSAVVTFWTRALDWLVVSSVLCDSWHLAGFFLIFSALSFRRCCNQIAHSLARCVGW